MKTQKQKDLYLSYSSIACFMDCRRKFYFYYERKLERIQHAPYYLTGNMVELGVSLLFAKDNEYKKKVLKAYNKAKQELRSSMSLTIQQEQELNEQEQIIFGMLEAYKHVHAKELKTMTHKQAQYKDYIKVNNLYVCVKIDNLLKKKNQLLLHELKTTRTLTPDYIRNIKNDLQTAIYFHVYNLKNTKKPIDTILYDVIQKPSIRQKQKESKSEYLNRLKEWYSGEDNNNKYYMETIAKPLIDKDRLFNIITKVGDDLLSCKTLDDFYPNERFCYVYRRCEYYEICHEGEKKELMINFRIKGGDKK